MKQINVLIFVASLLGCAAQAQTPCPEPRSARDVVACARANSQEVLINALKTEEAQSRIDVGSQRINPELDAEYLPNSQGGQTSEISIRHTFELGGKRSARIGIAEMDRNLQSAQLARSQQQAASQALLSLYRIRQIDTELALLEESSETFSEIVRSFRKRLRLNPEQEVALSIYELAAEDARFRTSKLEQSRRQALGDLSLRLGYEFRGNPKLLPPLKRDWAPLAAPLAATAPPPSALGTESQLADLQIASAGLELRAAEASAWPDLKIGPKASIETGQLNENRFGLALSIGLPLYQRNGAGRALAASGFRRAQTERGFSRAKVERERALLALQYEEASKLVMRAAETSKMSQRHRSLHKSLAEGFINASLVIELHRQMLEYQTSLHAQELEGIEALTRIQMIDGIAIGEDVK